MTAADPLLPHVLMTRFNMATPGREAAIRNRPDWLDGRFALFESFCLPSVAAQTTRDFTWIIYFDEATPQIFRDRIAALQREVPFHAYYTGLFPASGWPRSLREVLGPLPPLVLTSRLDNDDALAADYMERTATAARLAMPRADREGRIGIVITNGFIRSARGVYAMHHETNAFTSWLERSGSDTELMTALGISHMKAAEMGALVQVPGPGAWLQVVHGGNVSNKVRGRRVSPALLAGKFHPGALEGLTPAGAPALLLENGVLSPLRDARDQLASLTRRLRG